MLCRQNVVLGLFVLVCGVVVLVWPGKIQEIGIRSQERHSKLNALNPFRDFVRRPSYRIVISATGLVLILVSLVVFYFAWAACSE